MSKKYIVSGLPSNDAVSVSIKNTDYASVKKTELSELNEIYKILNKYGTETVTAKDAVMKKLKMHLSNVGLDIDDILMVALKYYIAAIKKYDDTEVRKLLDRANIKYDEDDMMNFPGLDLGGLFGNFGSDDDGGDDDGE